MIKLHKNKTPNILIENQQRWTSELLTEVGKYGCYSKIPKEEKDKLLVHYKHKEITDLLFKSSHEKCAFCETKPGESGNIEVEHFAPKAIYPNLTFEWDNFLPSCRKCNGSKLDHDTIKEPIVNPYSIDPEKYFYYKDIRIMAKENNNIGKLTIETCGLNSVRLMTPRSKILISLNSYSQSLEDAIAEYHSADTPRKKTIRKRKIAESLEIIEKFTQPSEVFSGYCKDYLSTCEAFHIAKKIIKE